MYNMEYALINLTTNEILEQRTFDEIPADISHKGIRWLPIVVRRPTCNIDSQIEEGPSITIVNETVEIVYTVKNLTQTELRQRLYDKINQQLFGKDVYVGQTLLLIYNELRQSQNQSKISSNDLINLILDTEYFASDTEENLTEYDKSGNPIN